MKSPYEAPMFQRVELAIDETLNSGCKTAGAAACEGPPIVAYNAGS